VTGGWAVACRPAPRPVLPIDAGVVLLAALRRLRGGYAASVAVLFAATV